MLHVSWLVLFCTQLRDNPIRCSSVYGVYMCTVSWLVLLCTWLGNDDVLTEIPVFIVDGKLVRLG